MEENLVSIEDIKYKEQSLSDQKARKQSLQEKLEKAAYPHQLATKSKELKELEEEREKLHLDLTTLNAQADLRAKLQIKKTEAKRKNEMIDSLCVGFFVLPLGTRG